MHLSASERGDKHLDDYKSEFYITATRLLRAFASLFIATSASTPMQAQVKDGRAAVILTEFDSIRNLTFPNPREVDLPDLYRSYNDYLQISMTLFAVERALVTTTGRQSVPAVSLNRSSALFQRQANN